MKTFQKGLVRSSSFFLPMFLASAAIMCIFVLTQGSDLLLQTMVLEEGTLELIKNQTQDGRSLFLYVLKQRAFLIPIIFLMSTTYLALLMVYGVIVWYGAAVGTVLGIAMLRYGVQGVLFLFVSALPQYLLYVPAVVAALHLSIGQRKPAKKFFIQLFVLELVVIIGCVLESYVNLRMLEKIIHIFII